MPGEIDYKRMLPLMFAVFVNIAGFSLILPLLPFYGKLFGAGAFEVALLFAAYSLGNVVGEIFWGRQSDRWGRRAVLVTTTACAAVTYVAFAYAPDLWLAIAIRVVSGFFGGTLSVAPHRVSGDRFGLDGCQPLERGARDRRVAIRHCQGPFSELTNTSFDRRSGWPWC